MHVDPGEARSAFLGQMDLLIGTAAGLSDEALLAPSRCTGWTVSEALVHVHQGLQEMLLGCVSHTDAPPDTDAASYWRDFTPTGTPDIAGIQFVRRVAAAYERPSAVLKHLTPTIDGVRAAVLTFTPSAVRFQGHVLPWGDFLATWAVELAVHHLDITTSPPHTPALLLARRTVETLAGAPLPPTWPDETVVLLGTGRVSPTPAQRAESPAVARLPVLG
ncbi:maleylpyruvate isomerase N-terminal domain-containing protein [Paractinoplanes atraurantiacus]|uniref:Mycothiol maleylpyruvate isomerase N-terminal domain-containing protein n=1 Tax=Paractinoplanes atraurantiacus TaxID=1036182 RepID=A0A285J814_9ACTN|nr:maleylpyruvate isomerase N-terminal domain-containing protein [Actinoplanes atraurantiacus]SNY56362.1 Mycothiol maleylpyruvate isomerase N-terminal domain-containing protein [Actinoplanes atraurantiacus]